MDLKMFRKMLWRLFGKPFHQRLQGRISRFMRLAGLEPKIHDEDRYRVLVKLQRQINVGAVPGKSRRRDTDDPVILVVKL